MLVARRLGRTAGAFLVLLLTGNAGAQLTATRVASGLSRPVAATYAPGDSNALYIAEAHTGIIKRLDLTTGATTNFLDIDNLATGNEQGLLGLTFDPGYATNGHFYVNVTVATTGATEIRRYTRTAAPPGTTPTGNLASLHSILGFAQPQANHNGGWIGFGPQDGYLYIATGDGGGSNDNDAGHTADIGNAQDTTGNLLGKMLRIDVTGDDFTSDAARNYRIPRGGAGQPVANPFAGDGDARDDEIWAYGLRNPFRASFDRATGDLYIGDVGQGQREEIDFIAAGSAGGQNFGWRIREGTIATPGIDDDPPGVPLIDPIHDYDRDVGTTVTGGYVYRGPGAGGEAVYYFADFGTGKIFSLEFDGVNISDLTTYNVAGSPILTDVGTIGLISSFGEDEMGRLYVVDLGGEVFRLNVPEPGVLPLLAMSTLLLARRARRRGGQSV